MDALARESRLKEQLVKLGDRYHTILIDCPPTLHLLTINALTAAHGVLIPVQCEYFALEGLSSLLDTIKAVRQRLNPKLEVEGLLRTMYDVRNNLGNEVSSQLTKHFGEKVLRSIIPRNIRLAEAPSHGKPINLYDRESRGAIAYLGLAGEMLRRERSPAATGAAESLKHGGASARRSLAKAMVRQGPTARTEPAYMAAKKRGLGRGLDALLGGDAGARRADRDADGELRTLADPVRSSPAATSRGTRWIPNASTIWPRRSRRRA